MRNITLSLCALLAAATMALAHSGATGIVKQRMDGMSTLGASMKQLVGIIRSGTPAPDKIRAIAQQIQAHSGENLLTLFPQGSLPHVSEASLAIWQDWAGFSTLAMTLDSQAIALETVAGGPMARIAAATDNIGQTCTACHKSYRIKK